MKVDELMNILAPLNEELPVEIILKNQQETGDIIALDIQNGCETIFDIYGYGRMNIGTPNEAFILYLKTIDV